MPCVYVQDAPLVLCIQQSYTKGGQQQPELLDGRTGAPVTLGQEGLALPAGQDRTQLLIRYAPMQEDPEGALGSIAITCTHAGMLLKAELSYTAKAVTTPKPGAVRKAGVSSGIGKQPPALSRSLKAPLPTKGSVSLSSKPSHTARDARDAHRRASADGSVHRDCSKSSMRANGDSDDFSSNDLLPDCDCGSGRGKDQGQPPLAPAPSTAPTQGARPSATKQLFPPQLNTAAGLPPQSLHQPPIFGAHTSHSSNDPTKPASAAAAALPPPPPAKSAAALRPPRMPFQPRSSLHLNASTSLPSSRYVRPLTI